MTVRRGFIQGFKLDARSVFSPFYQSCFLIGMFVAIVLSTFYHWLEVQPTQDNLWFVWQKGLDTYLRSMIWPIAIVNSYIAGRVYLRYRHRPDLVAGFSPGVWACFGFVAVSLIEVSIYLVVTNPQWQTIGFVVSGLALNVVFMLFASIAVLPIGTIVDRILGRAYIKDELILKQGRLNAGTH